MDFERCNNISHIPFWNWGAITTKLAPLLFLRCYIMKTSCKLPVLEFIKLHNYDYCNVLKS